jgi:hypothetical protein
MVWALEHPPKYGIPTFGAARLHVLLWALASYVNDDGVTFVSAARLASIVGTSRWHVDEGLACLADQGLVIRVSERGPKGVRQWRIPWSANDNPVHRYLGTSTQPGAQLGAQLGAQPGAQIGAQIGAQPSGHKGEGEEEEEGEGGALPRDPPPAEVIPINRDVISPFCDRHPNGTDKPCRGCQNRRREYERRAAEAAAHTCQWDGCTDGRAPAGRTHRYCDRHESLYWQG